MISQIVFEHLESNLVNKLLYNCRVWLYQANISDARGKLITSLSEQNVTIDTGNTRETNRTGFKLA